MSLSQSFSSTVIKEISLIFQSCSSYFKNSTNKNPSLLIELYFQVFKNTFNWKIISLKGI